MRASDKAFMRLSGLILPPDRIVLIDTFDLGIVNDILLSILFDQGFTKLLCFRSNLIDVIKADSAIAGCSCSEIFQIGNRIFIRKILKPLV